MTFSQNLKNNKKQKPENGTVPSTSFGNGDAKVKVVMKWTGQEKNFEALKL